MSQFGIEKTLQDFANQDSKLTRRKLKSWIESQTKVKGSRYFLHIVTSFSQRTQIKRC
jgi:hypothetical protein